MNSSLFFRIIVIVAGSFLLLLTFYMYAKRKLTDSIALGWALFSAVIIMAGAIRAWSGWSRALALASYPMVFSVSGLIILIIFRHSIHLSLMIMKNQELAMHVSLLNQENEDARQRLEQEMSQMRETVPAAVPGGGADGQGAAEVAEG